MLLNSFLVLCLLKAIDGVYYNSYSGEQSTDEDMAYYESAGNLMNCTNNITMPCDPTEPRRMDGSCNNLNYPTRGCIHTPLKRILPADPSEGDSERLSKSGKKLVLPRKARTHLLLSGKAKNPEYTQLFTHMCIHIFAEGGTTHDTMNYLNETLHCCEKRGKTDHMCTPDYIPPFDPVFQYTTICCTNLTRPKSFQSFKCIEKGESGLSRIEFATPTHDLSYIYQATDPPSDIRTYEGGLLKVDIDDGTTWPPHSGPKQDICFANQPTNGETRCLGPTSATIVPGTLLTIWTWRLHNVNARKLAAVNPHWSDERIFQTARDVSIAIMNEITFKEILPILLGRENMLESGLLPLDPGFRDPYDDTKTPHTFVEYQYVLRSLHTMQEGTMKMYDENYYYEKEEPMVNHTLRVGYLAKDGNLAKIARGAFLQPAAGNDRVVDPDIANRGLGGLERANDLCSHDLAKGRLLLIPSFTKYVEYYTNKSVECWDDLLPYVKKENIELLQEIYEHVEDCDLMSVSWVSEPAKGAILPEIFNKIVIDQFKHILQSDRHWYERPNRPNAFTLSQLYEVRKATVARYLCEVADINKIQREAFRRISPENQVVSCDEIPSWDMQAWAEDPTDYSDVSDSECSDEE